MTADTALMDVVCDFRQSFRTVFMLSLLAIVVLVPSSLYVEPGSSTHLITMIQLGTFTVLLLASGTMMVVCGRRAKVP